MKIEKKIAESRINLSSIAKKALATSLGMASSVTFIACGVDMADQPLPDTEPSGPSPESSNSDAFSSSSKYLDIPQSHEAISSEVLEALSSASQPASSVTQPTSNSTERISSAVQTTNSSASTPSSAAQPISSSTQGISSATQPASSTATLVTSSAEAKSSATQQQSSTAQPTSSSATTPASSAVQPASSSYDHWGTAINPCDGLPAGSTVETDFQVIICPDSSNSSWSSHGFSMVTTFERDDIEV